MAEFALYQPTNYDDSTYGKPYVVGGYDRAFGAFAWGPESCMDNPGAVVLDLVEHGYGSERAFNVVDSARAAVIYLQGLKQREGEA
ncbi:MAG TPA: hypothetical protein VL737_03475 [Candidatus Pristimantibacillus sp.]|jgi:hypothetical protein|nr:hypothetical protein [Candidatus Pristimantibacillus sp.]